MDEIDIREHIESSHRRGHLKSATCTHVERNPVCGDQVELQLVIVAGSVSQACFEAKGCMISPAAASILCEHIEGRSLIALRDFQAPQILALLRIPLAPKRQQCALLPFKALKTIVYSADPGEL